MLEQTCADLGQTFEGLGQRCEVLEQVETAHMVQERKVRRLEQMENVHAVKSEEGGEVWWWPAC